MIKCICRILKILLVVAAVCGMAYHGRIKEDFENYKMRAVPALMYHSISKRPAGWTEDLTRLYGCDGASGHNSSEKQTECDEYGRSYL